MGGLYKIVHEEPPRLAGAGWLGPVLEHTMVRDPEQRWTMAQVRDHLDAVRRGEAPTRTVAAAAAPVTDTAPRPVTRRDATPTADDTPVSTEVIAPAPAPATAPAPAPASARRRRSPLPWLVAAAAVLLVGILAFAALRDGTDQTAADPGTNDSSTSEPSPSAEPTSPSPESPTTEESPPRRPRRRLPPSRRCPTS